MTVSADVSEGVVVYQTTITSIGEQVPAFVNAGILILFSDEAPEELRDISVLHHADIREDGPQAGDMIKIGNLALPVLAVGHVVADNLLNLGHLDLKADDRTEAKLPGDVCVPKGSLAVPEPGQQFMILRPAP